jgi:TolB protein
MPTVSPDGRLLVYRSDRIEAEGLHRFDLTTGQDTRLTLHGWHYLPRFGGDNNLFLLAAQEPATQRWLIYQGFADGKSEPGAIRDGRTPALSPNGDKIAYQGVNPEGNDPGIYVIPFGGGEPVRLTHHESDRAPDFAPNGSQLAYMSTQNGTWDIYTVGVAGGTPTQVTSGGGSEGLPAWSPDGSRIAFVSDAGGSWGIYVVSAGGGQPTKIGPWDGANLPNWLEAQIGWMR